MAAAATATSAGGIISLLDENERELQYYGLLQLNEAAESLWAEISDAISKIEMLYEDESFEHRKLAALVASKIYFHLGEFDDALTFALGAGELFDLSEESTYVQTVINKAIDKYIELRAASDESSSSSSTLIDKRLENVVERMIEHCFDSKDYGQVVGIAIESRRLDTLERALKSGDTKQLLAYVQNDCIDYINSIKMQNDILELLIKIHMEFESPDYEAVCLNLSKLNSPEKTAEILQSLIESGDDDKILSGYQIAFDLDANATQEFTNAVIEKLPESASTEETADETESSSGEAEDNMKTDDKGSDSPVAMVKAILSGEETLKLYLEFLFRNNKVDMNILNRTCKYMDSRISLSHNAVTFANAYMHAGTTVDTFLRDNIEWLSRASSWSKFTATAALGVIHQGQIKHGFNILQPYLPEEGVSSSPFSEAGAFFALGLIHANHGSKKILDYLQSALTTFQGSNSEILQHGACLGIGAAGMGTCNEDLIESLRTVLYTDSAMSGEAAGIAMGLVIMGSNDENTIKDMLLYARETQHEKIIRSLAIGIGLALFGRQEQADALIAHLVDEEDPLLRLASVHVTTMAYCGTGDNGAIRRLLHLAVSDVNDDVRRAAVTGLGFLLLRSPEQVPRMVQLLSESFNPHVRFGATLALGISCAGSGSKAAIAILEPMLKDAVDFVVQGACIALAFILIQQNETYEPKVAEIRKRFAGIIEAKNAEPATKFGAALAQGILDAGGRNVTIGLTTRAGHLNKSACVGMLLFTQFWYWFPLAHFLPLAFQPTALIGVNKELQLPRFDAVCTGRKQIYAYPAMTEDPVVQAPTKVATAVLSTTAKTHRHIAKKTGGVSPKGDGAGDGSSGAPAADGGKKAAEEESAMEVDENPSSSSKSAKSAKKARSKQQSDVFLVENMSRVLPYQEGRMRWATDSRYVAVKQGAVAGVVVLRDTQAGEPEELIPVSLPPGPEEEEEEEEEAVQPPEPFEYPFDAEHA